MVTDADKRTMATIMMVILVCKRMEFIFPKMSPHPARPAGTGKYTAGGAFFNY
jgi:hypothetical protein